MPLIYITGTPGSGKSTVLRELQARGYKAYGTDEHGYSRYVNRKTNEVVIPPEEYDLHTWYKDHEWTLNPDAIAKLRHEADMSEGIIFLCGVAAGTDEAWQYFSRVIVLITDAETLKHRIANRKDNNFGKTPEELKIILEWQDKHVNLYHERGATTVDTATGCEGSRRDSRIMRGRSMNPQTTLTNDQIIAVFRKHGLAQNPNITRITVGFTNEVYAVDDYILKVCVKSENELNFRKEEFLYQLLHKTTPVPHVLIADVSRTLLDKSYMIYERLSGEPAASHWHEVTDVQRKQLIQSLCGYLRTIDQTPPAQYEKQLNVDPNFNWQQHIRDKLEAKLVVITGRDLLPETTIADIRRFVEKNRSVLEEQKVGLTFWDVHFDNILVDSSFRLSGLIDFESVDVYPIDYRLMVIRLMQRYPHLYFSEAMEPYANREDYTHLMDWYKEFYPEMFAFNEMDTRIDLYELLDIVSKLPDWPKAEVLRERLSLVLNLEQETL